MAKRVMWVNADLYTPWSRIAGGRLLIGPNGKIEAVGGEDSEALRIDGRTDVEVKDAGGRMLLPGFVDIHVHGGGGHDGMEGGRALAGMSRYHAGFGTTSFLPTVVCAARDKMLNTIEQWRDVIEGRRTEEMGAEAVGIHIEGPFLNPLRGGAQNRAHLRVPDIGEMEDYLRAAGPWVKLVTLAPELEGAGELIALLRERGITVSAGHTNATYDQMRSAAALGVSHVTHHYNGMSPLLSREPGATGAGLLFEDLTIELIADGYHVHPDVIAMAFALKPEGRIALITDAMLCAGCPDGLYQFDGVGLVMRNGKVALAEGDSLAGSSLNMMKALTNAMAFTGLPPEKVLPALTSVPARQAGVNARKGSLAAGMDADFLIVDAEWQVRETYVKGRRVFAREAARTSAEVKAE